MSAARTETDYLIVGAGAMGLAFADEIFHSLPDARITIVDRRAKPGGHWNDSYRYVRLHQPAAAYGVNSAPLGTGGADLSSQAELLAYFERVMAKFLASGRVEFLAKSEYLGGGRVAPTLEPGRVRELVVQRRTVDATYMRVEVPATHPPRYAVDPEVPLVPPNALVRIDEPWESYVIVGAGKTGGDAVVFLLDSDVEPERIQWIVSNDMWMWNRAVVQPEVVGDEFLRQLETLSRCATADEVFLELERKGSVFRLDRAVLPRKWRCATFDRREHRLLCSVKEVVRAGRVERIGTGEIQLTGGTIPNGPRNLIIDCSANGLAAREPRPIFEPGRITLQSVFMCQQVFSSALIGQLEVMNLDDDERNAMVQVVPHPESTRDLPGALVASFRNVINAMPRMPAWLLTSRLNILSHQTPHRVLRDSLRTRRAYPGARSSAQRMLAVA